MTIDQIAKIAVQQKVFRISTTADEPVNAAGLLSTAIFFGNTGGHGSSLVACPHCWCLDHVNTTQEFIM